MPVVKSKSAAVMEASLSTGQKKMSVTAEERYQMIAEAAYFHAEKYSFSMAYAMQDWFEAGAEIDPIKIPMRVDR